MGNVIGIKKSKADNPKKLMIEAHMDEIGLMITNIDDNGFLNFTTATCTATNCYQNYNQNQED